MGGAEEEVIHLLSIVVEGAAGRQAAEDALREMERATGFHSCLLELALGKGEQQKPTQLRLLALIVLKNAIDRCFRPMTKTPVDPAERTQIKQFLMRTFDEPDKGIAVMVAVVVARIARFDWPR
jgi:hypothetical protein